MIHLHASKSLRIAKKIMSAPETIGFETFSNPLQNKQAVRKIESGDKKEETLRNPTPTEQKTGTKGRKQVVPKQYKHPP